MTDIAPAYLPAIDAVTLPQRPAQRAAVAPAASAPAPALKDRVELSEHARLLSLARALPDTRADLVEKARANIASGAYDAGDVLDAILDRLAEEVSIDTTA